MESRFENKYLITYLIIAVKGNNIRCSEGNTEREQIARAAQILAGRLRHGCRLAILS